MQQVRTLKGVLKNATPDQWYESFSWLAYNFLGSTLPIWLGGFILLPVFSRHFNLIEYSVHGELALYCAAFLAPTLRLIGRDVEDFTFVRRQAFLLFGWIGLTAAVGLYSGVISAAEMPGDTVHVNSKLLFYFSLALFVVSVAFSWLVRLIDFQRIQPREVFQAQRSSAEKLNSAFDELVPRPTPAISTVDSALPGEASPIAAAESREDLPETPAKNQKESPADRPGGDNAE